MSQWIDRITGHQVFAELNSLDEMLTVTWELAQTEVNATDAWDRINRVAVYCRHILGRIDPLLMPLQPLNSIFACLQQIRSELSAYSSNHNIGHLNNANTQLDTCLLVYLGQLSVVTVQDDVDDLRESASNYRRSIGQLARNLQDEISTATQSASAVQTRLQELTQEIGTQKQRLDTAISNFQQQFSQAEETRRSEFSQAEQKRTTDFTEAEDLREETFNNSQEANAKAFSELLEKSSSEFKTTNTDLLKRTENLISLIEEQKSHAEKLVGIITDTGMVGGYQRVANEEQNASRLWKIIALIAMVGLIGFSVWGFDATLGKPFDWGHAVSKLFVTLAFVFLAGYAGIQADRHQRTERMNRRLELAIASIDPFLATLGNEERNEVKRQLAEKLFVQTEQHPVVEHVETKTAVEILKAIYDTVSKKQGS